MGIESDKLVFDFLSRVGDLAHSTSMSAADRARLVSELRGEIDRQRSAAGGAENQAAVRRILKRFGSPADIVAGARGGAGGSAGPGGGSGAYAAGAGDGGGGGGASEGPSVPAQRSGPFSSGGPSTERAGRPAGTGSGTGLGWGGGAEDGDGERPSLWKRAVGGSAQKDAKDAPPAPDAPTASRGASAPHLAGSDELGPRESDPDWWRTDPAPHGVGDNAGEIALGGAVGGGSFGETVPGFVGGIEIPELLKPPPADTPRAGDGAPRAPGVPLGKGNGGAAPEAGPAAASGTDTGAGLDAGLGGGERRGWARLLPGRSGGAGAGVRAALGGSGPRRGGFVELAAVVLLFAGAAVGSLIPLAVGWLAAWWSPRLSRTEAKWAAAGMPGLVAAGTAVWLWGRLDGRWGAPIAQGGTALQHVLADSWPVLLRVAAVSSALFLLWRARRSVVG